MIQPLPLSELLANVGIDSAIATPVSGMALDSRELQPGDVFLALAGQREHGVRHAAQAHSAGAAAMLIEEPLPPDAPLPTGLPWQALPGLRQHIAALTDRLYAQPSAALDLIGVTGTNGKTSTVQFIASAAQRCGRRCATQGTLGRGRPGALQAAERTTPDLCSSQRFLAQMREQGCDLVAMEVSSHALEQGRVAGLRFAVAVYTNLSRDHLDYHGSMQAYFEAKARLFTWPDLGAAVINLDDAHAGELCRRVAPGCKLLRYSASGRSDADLQASDVHLDAAGLHFRLRYGEHQRDLHLPLLGRFNLENVLAATGALLALGLDFAAVTDALAQLQAVPGRMNRLGGGSAPLVVIDYAHTPDALAQALSALREHIGGRLIVVFGCGGERDRGKRPQMAAVAEAGADLLVVTDDNPRGEDGDGIVGDIVGGLLRPELALIERDRARAIALAIARAAPDDLVLVAGKGHESYQEIGGLRRPFDDLQVARACLERAA